MKRTISIVAILLVSIAAFVWTSSGALASCPSGKVGMALTQDNGSFIEFRWSQDFVADPPEDGVVKVRFAFLPFDGIGGVFQLSDDNAPIFTPAIDGQGETQGLPYDTDDWNNVTITLDFDSQTVDLKINGEPAFDLPFENPATDLTNLYPQYNETTSADSRIAYLDSIKVTVTGESAPVYSENFESVEDTADLGSITSVSPPDYVGADGAGCPTKITLNVGKTATKIQAAGGVTPGHPGGDVVIKLFKKKDGKFVEIVKKEDVLNGSSAYSTTFNRPNADDCKITARFVADDDHLSSTTSKTFAC